MYMNYFMKKNSSKWSENSKRHKQIKTIGKIKRLGVVLEVD